MTWRLAALLGKHRKAQTMTTTQPETTARDWMTRRRELLTGSTATTTTVDYAVVVPAGTRTMVDSAWPLKNPPPTDIVLIYAGGDTPHAWTQADIDAQPARYRWPCWVRSNPGQVGPVTDATACIKWLEQHNVPKGTCVILDLETAVNAVYVDTFDTLLRAAGWKTTKYGSRNFIWKNPRTDGGTFLADPGPPHMSTVGDTVATQWGFFGDHDMSWVKDQKTVPLWDTRPPKPAGPFRHVVPAGNTQTWHQLAASRGTTDHDLAAVTCANLDAVHLATFDAFMVLNDALHAQGSPLAVLPAGFVWWSLKP